MALEFLVKKRHCKRQNGGAPDLSQSDCVRCRHHVGFKGPPFLVFRNRVVLFQNSCTMLYRLPADLLVSSFKSHWSAIPHILLGTWYTGILELGLLDYFIHWTTWPSKILGPQYHMFYSTVTQVCPARPWGSQHSTVN